MTAHRHTTEGGKSKAEKKQDIQDARNTAIWIVFSLKQYSVPLPVQNLMDNDKYCHAYADPFMCHFSCNLVGHEKEKKDGHGCIYYPFYDNVLFHFGHGAVPPQNQFIFPQLPTFSPVTKYS